MPEITVIMPVYNAEKYLKEALESILQQTYANFEFLIFNDGSIDKSAEIIRQYARHDQRICFYDAQENVGYVTRLNQGLALACGKYIARQDADDISFPTRLEKEIQCLEQHAAIWLVGTAFHIISESGKLLGVQQVLTDNSALQEALAKANQFGHGTVMYRTALLDSIGGYRKSLEPAEDYDFWLRIAEKYMVANLPEPLYQWRVNPQGVSVSQKKIQDQQGDFAKELALERKLFGKDRLQNTPDDQIQDRVKTSIFHGAISSEGNNFLVGKFLYEKGAYWEALKFFGRSLLHESCSTHHLIFILKSCLKYILPPIVFAKLKILVKK